MVAVIDKIKEELNKDEVNIFIGHGYITMKREEAIDVFAKIDSCDTFLFLSLVISIVFG